MSKTTAVLLATIAVLAALPAHAVERKVDFMADGKKVDGTLTLPGGVAQPPVVLMLNGFTGMRHEWKSDHVPKRLFGLRGTPSTLLIGRDGSILHHAFGVDENMAVGARIAAAHTAPFSDMQAKPLVIGSPGCPAGEGEITAAGGA